MKVAVERTINEPLSDDVLDLLLDEAERALLDVDARPDEPGRRLSAIELTTFKDVEQLRLAIAELSDAYPRMQYELESISDRLRNVGAIAATAELESYPHIIHLARMSLEVFFRQFPTLDVYEADYRTEDGSEDEIQSPAEMYDCYRQLVSKLRTRLS